MPHPTKPGNDGEYGFGTNPSGPPRDTEIKQTGCAGGTSNNGQK